MQSDGAKLDRKKVLFENSMARLQSPGTGSGLETKRSALDACISVDTYSYQRSRQLSSKQWVSLLGSEFFSQNTRYQKQAGRTRDIAPSPRWSLSA